MNGTGHPLLGLGAGLILLGGSLLNLSDQSSGATIPDIQGASSLSGEAEPQLSTYRGSADSEVLAQAASSSGRISVKDFGARGDGVTDDTAALNRAAAEARGRDVIFPAGIYLIRGPVVFSNFSDQVVRGEGATVQAAPNYQHGKSDGMLHFNSPVNVHIRDLKIVGNRDPLANPYAVFIDGIRVSRGKNVTISGTHIMHAPTNGIAFEDSDTVTIRDNTIISAGGAAGWAHRTVRQRWLNNEVTGFGDPGGKQKGGLGIFATIGNDFVAEGNVLKNLANTATKTEGVNNVVYRNNTVDVFGKDGIKVMPFPGHNTIAENVLIEGNTIRAKRAWAPDGSAYILLHSVHQGSLRNNKIDGTGGKPEVYSEDAIKVNTWRTGPASKGIVIEGNQIKDTRRGVRIEADNVVIRKNSITGSLPWARSAIIVGGHGITIKDNQFSGPAIGILIDRGMSRTQIEGNQFENLETAVYADNDNADTKVTRNQFGAGIQKAVSGPVNSECNYYNSTSCR